MHLPWWFLPLSMLTLAVPVTSLVLIGSGTGWFISRRKGRFGPARIFAWCTVAIAPFWLAGTGFGAWMISGMMAEDAERARLNYKVREATVIDGVAHNRAAVAHMAMLRDQKRSSAGHSVEQLT